MTARSQRRALVRTGTEIFGLDVRSLALFRICLGVVLLVDLLCRAVDLRAHYTDFGVLPRGAALSQFMNEWYLSIHLINGTAVAQCVLFSFSAFWAVALLVGYRTTVATLLSWFLLISLHNRNSMVVDGGDIILHMLLFWAMFLPLGASYSLDTVFSQSEQTTAEHVVSPGSVALILQICFLYWFTAILKNDPSWRQNGLAVTYALNIDAFATPIGMWLRQFPQLLMFLTFATLVLEFAGPFLLFVPVWTSVARLVAMSLFLGFHIGLGLCLTLGIFPVIMGTAWLCLLPPWFWQQCSVPVDFSLEQKQRIRRFVSTSLGVEPREGRWLVELPLRWFSLVKGIFCLLCLLYVFLWNLRTINFERYSRYLSSDYNWFGYTLRLDQMWDLFAPKPLMDDGWYVIPAHLRNGEVLDLMTGEPVRWEKPALVSTTYRNQRWRKYLLNLWERENAGHRLYFGRYLCRDWNSRHRSHDWLQTFQIYFMKEETLPGGKIAPPEQVLLWDHNCFAPSD
ncbi:MAG: HTTM domain-containing protein [Candidatus Binatia bacterium]